MICTHRDAANQRCNEWAETEPDKSKPVETTESNKDNGIGLNISWPTKPTKDGLCYYHHKKSLGMFDEDGKMYQHFLNALDGRYTWLRRR